MNYKSGRTANWTERKAFLQEIGEYDSYLKKQSDYAKRRKTIYKQKVVEAYGGSCNCCGETELTFLTVDHVNNDGYMDKGTVHRGGVGLYSKIIKDGFPDIYQILCWNCNWGKAAHGICPHKKGDN